MKKFVFATLAVALLSTPSLCDDAAIKEAKKPWLDLHNCEMCKNMSANVDMSQVTWENHKIANGCMSASVLPKEQQPKMAKAQEKMAATSQRLGKGEKLQLCGYCEGYGELMQAGVKVEEIKTEFGMVTLITSADPAIVKKIHAHTDKTIAAYKAMTAKN